jgi:hypothetical protein
MINPLSMVSIFSATVNGGGFNINIFAADPDTMLANILYMVYLVAAIIAVIAIIVAGYTFTTSAYDAAKVTQAKNAILYAVTGLVFIIIAFVITNFVLKQLG